MSLSIYLFNLRNLFYLIHLIRKVRRDSRKAAQGVQPLVRNEVTQNSPDFQSSGLLASQSAHTGLAPV